MLLTYIMKKILILSMALLITQTMMSQNTTKIIAHRGAWQEFSLPENSIASLQKAIELHCYGAEFDVRRTKDGILVVNHDPFYFGDTIELHTYDELNKHKLSNGEDLPTLEKYFTIGTQGNEHTYLICEIKEAITDTILSQKATLETLALVKKLGIGKKVIYISFGFEVVKTIKKYQPDALVLYLENNKSIGELVNEKINGINYHYTHFINKTSLALEAKQHHLLIGSWTVNTKEVLENLIGQGVEFITTNTPSSFLNMIKQ